MSISESGESAVPDDSASVTVVAELNSCVNYACWQNSVPFLRSLLVRNGTDKTRSDLRLAFATKPAFASQRNWVIDRLNPGDELSIIDRTIEFDASYLNGLNEAERGQVTLTLSQGSEPIVEQTSDVRILARDEWGGFNGTGEILAAFVMPNDPAIAKVIKNAGAVLAKHGHSSALDGYQSGDPRRAFLLAAAIWSSVAAEGLTYANPPKSFESVGQKTRRPTTVLSDGLATCLDATLLFAAAIEAVGLNPVIVFQHGHCFAGVWLIETTFNNLIETDVGEVRKALAAHELITFETTLVTQQPPATFNNAVAAAKLATQESEENRFVATIDIARARMAQIRPLASHEAQSRTQEEATAESNLLPLPKTPDLGSVAAEIVEEKPATSAGRVERWQRKLLDLGLRNRLLNFKFTKQTIPFLCADISQLEDKLAGGTKIKIISLPENNPIGDRDAELHFQKSHKDLDTEFAASALQRNELATKLESPDLGNRLTVLYRRARNDLAEGGSNTLFLAVGFLKWKRNPKDSDSYRAPLMLIPVKLVRKSALSPFQLVHHEDEVRFNATLIQLLKKDFDRDLSQFEGDLPTDHSGIDVLLVLDRMRLAVREIPGFEVIDETALSTFSFAKYLMWKDLVDRIDQLEQNRVVKHLIRNPDKAFQSGVSTAFPQSCDIDRKYDPRQLVHPLPADSSQLAAVASAAEGRDFVLIGPPGTGKSQTIANMIAQCLANGRTVLFVAEKTAALDVVYRRLREHGLGEFCLELHSNKAERRQFLDQMKDSWEMSRQSSQDEWLTVNETLRIRRDELNNYVEALHAVDPSGWTVFRAMGVSVKGAAERSPELDWPDSLHHNAEAYQSLIQLVDELSLTFGALKDRTGLRHINSTKWSAAWEADLMKASDSVSSAAQALQQELREFSSAISIPARSDASLEELDQFSRVSRALAATADDDYRVIFNKQFSQLPQEAENLDSAISEYNTACGQTAANYTENELLQVPTDDLERQWREANARHWPLSFFAKRRVTKLLQGYVADGIADPQCDLPQIRIMRQQLGQIAQSKLATESQLWNGRETDTSKLREHMQKAVELREAIVALGNSTGALKAVSSKLGPVVSVSSAVHPVFTKSQALLGASQKFLDAMRSFKEVAGAVPSKRSSGHVLDDTIQAASQIQASRKELQRWTAWCEVKERSVAHGLGVFVSELESTQLTPSDSASAFELAYVRWWLPRAIDRSDILRSFQRYRHEDAIQSFREIDELALTAATTHVRHSLAHNLPKPSDVPRKSELGVLRHQMQLKRPSKTIRQVISAMPESFGKLAPCLLMSPLSISQYLPSDQALFDVVIFDEASQITTWDAIGAIARGRQTVIVGDPKQLPPTNFFGRSDNDEDNEELDDHERDLESILDEATASGLPRLQLNWHYRSSHESLIAFSNWHYYNNKLITFPSAVTDDQAVSLKYLPDGVYDRGKSRTNRYEAQAIVDDAVARMRDWLTFPEDERYTLGVITFNSQQQSLIQDLFDQAQRDNPEIEWFFSDERVEPTVVKNLENVQGDERDVMLFSITFSPNAAGKVPLTFGALNRDGGERRLNVAVTRSRRELVVYSSFKADQFNVDGTKSRGVWDLKNFLDYADRGAIALSAEQAGSQGEFESPFEEAVAEKLIHLGWQVVPQIGVSSFRVDLGVVHPDKPGAYMAGIECDGATYHRSATARDRDKIREQILRHLGWEILRVWSPDWWYDCDGAVERIHEALNELLARSRTENPPEEAEPIEPATEDANKFFRESPPPDDQKHAATYHAADLEPFDVNPDSFYDEAYAEKLRQMVLAVVEAEAPIRDDMLAQRIARAHGFARTGAKIRDRVFSQLQGIAGTEESTGRFLWSPHGPLAVVDFRYPLTDDERRSVDNISLAELCGLILHKHEVLEETDPALMIARELGLGRLKASSRIRLEEAITRVKADIENVASDEAGH
jgi:very-short-patch-repair endonuclease